MEVVGDHGSYSPDFERVKGHRQMEIQLEIPNKSFFKMNEVCELTGLRPYVLRFWETEFNIIRPIVSESGQKLYEHKDIEAIAIIKKLLFEEKLTIEKAKFKLQEVLAQMEGQPAEDKDQGHGLVRRKQLSERDIQKLILAKAKLQSIISTLNSLEMFHQREEDL